MSGACTTPGGSFSYTNAWYLGYRFDRPYADEITWNIRNARNGYSPIQFSVDDLNADGWWTDGTVRIGAPVAYGAQPLCDYIANYCGP